MSELSESEKALFRVAVSLEAGERDAFLNQACGDNLPLLQNLRRLLDADHGRLHGPVNFTGLSDDGDLGVPAERIGRYKLLQEIGEGGFGIVYMAEQQEPVVRKVALKIIKPGMDSKQVIARFESERQALALMEHPNIARVLDAGETDAHRPYFVMELVRGLPITEFCDEHRLPTRDRLTLFADVCSAIHHAHQKGIIHRDVKPTNILVTTYADRPLAKVIDFGIAKATQGRLTDKTVFTQFQQMIGTPAYMSPEQAALSAVEVDTRSDIYSLGVLLYQLLTGVTPLDSKQLVESSFDELRRRIRDEEPPKPSTRISTMTSADRVQLALRQDTRPDKIGKVVRGELDWIVMKAIEKDRSRRYETANSLLTDVECFLAGESVSAAAPSQWYRFAKAARRNRVLLATTAAMFAALAIGLCVSLVFYSRERKALNLAEDNVYAADMKLASTAMGRGQAMHTLELLHKHEPGNQSADRRGWMWQHLWWRTHRDLATIDVHGIPQKMIAAPDGKTILIAGSKPPFNDATLAVVDPISMKVRDRHQLKGIQWVGGMTPIVGTNLVAVESMDEVEGSVTFVDLESREQNTYYANTDWPPRVSVDGKSIVCMYDGFRVRLERSIDSVQRRTEGKAEIIIARVDDSYHFRVFDTEGRRFDRPRSSLVGEEKDKRELIDLLTGAFRANKLTRDTESKIARLVTRLSGEKSWETKQFRCIAIESGEVLGESPAFLLHNWDYLPHRIEMSPDGKRIAAGCYGSTVSICEMPGLALVDEFDVKGQTWCVAWSSDSKSLAVGTTAGIVELWDLSAKGEQRLAFDATLRVHPPVRNVCFSNDGTRLAVSTLGQSVTVWDIRNASKVQSPVQLMRYDQADVAPMLAFAADGNRLASEVQSGHVKIWDTSFATTTDLMKTDGQLIWDIALARDGTLLAVIGADGIAQVFDTKTEMRIKSLQRHPALMGDHIAEYPYSEMLCFSPDGRFLVTANGDQSATIYDVKTWEPERLLDEYPDVIPETITDITVSPDSQTIVTSRGWAVMFWNAVDGSVQRERIIGPGKVMAVEFSPDGKLLALGSDNGRVALWGVAEEKVIRTVRAARSVEALRFSHSGEILACGSRDAVELFDVPSLKLKKKFTGMVSNIQGLAFAPDDMSLIASCLGGIVRVFNLKVMDNVGDLMESDDGWLTSVCMSPDGRTVYVADRDGGVRKFHAASLD